jgi:2-dehydropantoate 2-reductase
MPYEIWRKLVLNCVINPLTALYQVRNKDVAVESLRGVINNIVNECRDVAAKEGVTIDQDMAKKVYDMAAKYSNMSSMCQDIIKGKKTEIDFLNGRVSELGRRYGVATPVNDTLSALIHYLEGRR